MENQERSITAKQFTPQENPMLSRSYGLHLGHHRQDGIDCPSKINMGTFMVKFRPDKEPYPHVSLLANCFGVVGHEGPHYVSLDEFIKVGTDEASLAAIADHPFTLTWTDDASHADTN